MESQEIKITSLEGNGQWLDGGAMFGNAPRALWTKWCEPDSLGRVRLACRSLLVELRGLKVLCEVGIGAYMDPQMSQRFGVEKGGHKLRDSIKRLGLEEGDIDFVILSHLHFDHAGGLLPSYEDIAKGNDQLLFENATYVVGEKAFERALNPHFRDKASFIPGMADKLIESGRILVIKEGETIPQLEGVLEFYISNGHTPGQMHSIFHGKDSSIIFAGDLIPGIPWVNLPITMGYDRFPELLIDEKKNLYNRVVPENWEVFYTHDSQYATSKVKVNEKGKYEAYAKRHNLLGESL